MWTQALLGLSLLIGDSLQGDASYVFDTVHEAVKEQMPFPPLVTLVRERNPERAWCGGTLLTPQYVLTSATCAKDVPVDEWTAFAGLSHLGDRVLGHPVVQRSNVTSVAAHDEFNAETELNDIAILTLQTPVEYTEKIQPVTIRAFGDSVELRGDVSLYGFRDSQLLMRLDTSIVDRNDCKRRWESTSDPKNISASQICTETKGVGVILADLGGPVIEFEKLQVGIISFHDRKFPKSHIPNVHTRVASFCEWIHNSTNYQFSCS